MEIASVTTQLERVGHLLPGLVEARILTIDEAGELLCVFPSSKAKMDAAIEVLKRARNGDDPSRSRGAVAWRDGIDDALAILLDDSV